MPADLEIVDSCLGKHQPLLRGEGGIRTPGTV